VDEVMYPDAQAREEDGKKPTQAVFDQMAYVPCCFDSISLICH
jgi:hypothetical protein